MLPQRSQIRAKLDYDIFYKPKDIIGGDFYFFQHVREKIFVAVCDCTGHGIPGALMSVVCHEALCDAILEHELDDPAAILAKARDIIIDNLNAREQKIQDGMEASLLVIDPFSRRIQWCGAFTPLWYCSGNVMHEIKGDKQSVSFGEKMGAFTTHEINAAFGSVFYLFTDGYADQFGGADGKKFKYKPMKDLLYSVNKDNVSAQAECLKQRFEEWKAELEQVDDVAVGVIRF